MRSRVMIALGLSVFAVIVSACRTTESRVREGTDVAGVRKVDFIAEDQRQILNVETEFVSDKASVSGTVEKFGPTSGWYQLKATGCRVQWGTAFDPTTQETRRFVKVIVRGGGGSNSGSAETMAYMPVSDFPPNSTMPEWFEDQTTFDYFQVRTTHIYHGDEFTIWSSHIERAPDARPQMRHFSVKFKFNPTFTEIAALSFEFSANAGVSPTPPLNVVHCGSFRSLSN